MCLMSNKHNASISEAAPAGHSTPGRADAGREVVVKHAARLVSTLAHKPSSDASSLRGWLEF